MPQSKPQATPPPPALPPGAEAQRLLQLKRGELTDQLRELTDRRRELQSQRERMSSAAGRDHDARITAIDQRSAEIEQQLFATNDMISRGLTDAAAATEQFSTAQPDVIADAARAAATDATRETAVTITLSLVAAFVVWQGLRRFFGRTRRPALAADNSAQLARLQQSMDAIAIEVERISEAQRYTARLMNERGIGAGEAHPVPAPQPEAAGTPKRL